jgi:hypothetical protein
MRKLVAALAVLAVLGLPAAALAQPRWHRGSNAQVSVYVERTKVGSVNWSQVKAAGPSGRAAAASGSCSSTAAPPGGTA